MKINVIGGINRLSYGYVTQNIVKSLLKFGHELNLTSIGPCEPDEIYAPYIERCGTELDDNPTLIIWHHHGLKQFVRPNVLNIGFPIFEVNAFSQEEIEQLNSVDMLFTTCEWYKNILEKVVRNDLDIVKIPLGVDPDVFFPVEQPKKPQPTTLPTHMVKEDPVKFLNIGKFELRKGHQELIKAFGEEFKNDHDNVSLTLACDNPFIGEDNAKWATYASKYIKPEQLNILPVRFDSCKDMAKLIAAHDIGVFPSKAEGWGLPLLECIASGKRVIATNYSAHTEFCGVLNADLIDITEDEPCFDGQFFHGQGTWAKLGEPQIAQLRAHMRRNYNFVKQGKNDIKRNPAIYPTKFTWDETTKQIAWVIQQRIQ